MEYNEQYLQERDDHAAKAAKEYQDHVFALKIYEGLCKDFMAAIKMQIRAENPGQKISESELETRARSMKEWLNFRNEQMEVLREAGRRQMQYENAKRRHQTAVSGLAMRREEVRRFQG